MQSCEIEFADFCKTMWFRNCVERSDWKEDPLDYDKYVQNNLEFLKQKHVEYRLEKFRRE